jgi:hypothetical protein
VRNGAVGRITRICTGRVNPAIPKGWSVAPPGPVFDGVGSTGGPATEAARSPSPYCSTTSMRALTCATPDVPPRCAAGSREWWNRHSRTRFAAHLISGLNDGWLQHKENEPI